MVYKGRLNLDIFNEPLLDNKDMIEHNVGSSRLIQETFRIQQGESCYSALAKIIEIDKQQIDEFARFCGTALGDAIINYRNSNLLLRGIVTDNNCSQVGTIASVTTEFGIKALSEGVRYFCGKKANYDNIEKVYSFLWNYAYSDINESDMRRAKIELLKIRNGFPLSDSEKKKLHEKYIDEPVTNLEDMHSFSIILNNEDLCEALSYQIFVLYCQKYGDENGILAENLENRNTNYKGMKRLLEYYDFLGYTGSHARELIRENANSYDTISRDQNRYIEFGGRLVTDYSFELPNVDIDRIRNHCTNLSKCAPCQLRKRKPIVTKRLGDMLIKRPDIAINSGALALSQFNLNNDVIIEKIRKNCRNEGMDSDIFELVYDKSKDIMKKTNLLT
ncbi:hypothetical protein SAMN05216390_102362 [Lachnospiraceae bacterium KH1T2]|nr:hypothetical protein SAMN05216390_102362 [Lachnospiraceae bacterium KH1T2]